MRLSLSLLAILLPISIVETRRSCSTDDPTPSQLLESETMMKEYLARSGAQRRKRQVVNVPIHWHMIKKKNKGKSAKDEKDGVISESAINEGIERLNAAFAPNFSFIIASIEINDNKRYWHIDKKGDDDMKKELRKGDCSALNIYSTRLKQQSLGWATMPNYCFGNMASDGVVIDYGTAPGGNTYGYNKGGTLIHETGHWLGLYHTFQGGCDGNGDQVADTPAVAHPNYYCQDIDSCPNDGLGVDQVENFMDYGDDFCASEFSEGQLTRMTALWNMYRSDERIEFNDCKKNENLLMIQIKTDMKNRQTRFIVKRGWPKKKLRFTVMKELGKNMKKNDVNTFYECIQTDKFCYQMRIFDKGHDGICCKNGKGFFSIWIDGSQIWKNNFENLDKQKKRFGNCLVPK